MCRMPRLRCLLLLLAFLLSSGCYDKPTPAMRDAAVGGIGGAAAGAGIGALIGSVIANGDVPMSALWGGGIGLASGIVLALTYRSMLEQAELLANEAAIARNEQRLVDNYRTISAAREDLTRDAAGIEPDPAQSEHVFTGPSIGVYNR